MQETSMLITKISLLVSVLLFGYNLSLVLNKYVSVSKKALLYRDILRRETKSLKELRKTNLITLVFVAFAYITLLYFSGLSFYLLSVVAFKFLISLFLSDKFQNCVVKGISVSKNLFYSMKIDASVNFIGSVFLCCVIIS